MHKLRNPGRNKRGNMIAITVGCIALILFACIAGFAFYMLLTEQQRSQGVVDQVALSLAKKMNDGDRIGGLNNLLAMNRELVNSSRTVEQNCITYQTLNFADPLAMQLLNEARTSTTNLDGIRLQQIKDTQNNIRFDIDKYNLNRKNLAHFNLPWWQSFEPEIHGANVGYVEDTVSNVLHNDYFRPLLDWDDYEKFVQTKSDLFMGNVNAKLPSADNDLDFKITALAAPVETTVAPGRLLNPEAFKQTGQVIIKDKTVNTKVDQIPTAIQLTGSMQVSSGDNKQLMKIASIAACPGAEPLPPYPPELTGYWAWAPDGTYDLGPPVGSGMPPRSKIHNRHKGGKGGKGHHEGKKGAFFHQNR